MGFLKRFKLPVAIITLFALLLIIESGKFKNPIKVSTKVDSSPVMGEAGFARITEPGWSVPAKLAFNDKGWEDSSYITRDGRYVLFFYHPTISQFDQKALEATGVPDGKIYFSKRPFLKKELHPISTPGLPSDGGPYIAKNGDMYYMSIGVAQSLNIGRNGKDLDLGTGGEESNPHYCDAEEELYFDAPDGKKIAMHKKGKTYFLPEPINLPNTQNFQAFLTDDCQTLYFTSTRGAWQGILPLQVYRSKRLGELSWAEPTVFVKFDRLGGVGEFSMTQDGRQAVFTQMSLDADGVFRNNIFYSEKN